MTVYFSRRDLPIVEELVFASVPKDLRFVILIHAETIEASRNKRLTYGSWMCLKCIVFPRWEDQVSSHQSPGTQLIKGMITNHYMDPYNPIRISWNVIHHQLRDPYSHSHQLGGFESIIRLPCQAFNHQLIDVFPRVGRIKYPKP